MVIDGISEDIRRRREEYLELMAQHGSMSPAEIIASVRETQARLLDVFNSVTESDALRKPAPGEWCLRELAQHAVFTERLIAKIIHHGARGEIPSREDLEGAGIGMMPPDDGKTYDEILDDLRSMNDALVRSLEELPAEPNRELRMPHPFFGPLDCLEWAGFQRVHDTDHIHHAEKIIASTAE